MAGEWMLKDDWDEIEELGKVSARLEAEVARLTAERAAIGSDHHDAISAIRLENYTLKAEVARLRERAERAEAALSEIRAAQPRWVTGVGSYAGGETWAGFARRLQSIAGLDAAPAGEGGAP